MLLINHSDERSLLALHLFNFGGTRACTDTIISKTCFRNRHVTRSFVR